MTQTSNRFFDEIGRLMNDALGGARGVIHQTPDLVEKPIAGLGHLWGSPVGCKLVGQVRQWRSGRPCSRPALPSRGKSPCHVPVSLQSYRLPTQKTEKPRSEKQRPMIDQQIEIPTKDGHVTTFISHPE